MTIDILGTAYDVAYIDKPPQGLDDCAGYMSVDAWAVNEEMVDWFAAMAPRMIKTFKEAQAL